MSGCQTGEGSANRLDASRNAAATAKLLPVSLYGDLAGLSMILTVD